MSFLSNWRASRFRKRIVKVLLSLFTKLTIGTSILFTTALCTFLLVLHHLHIKHAALSEWDPDWLSVKSAQRHRQCYKSAAYQNNIAERPVAIVGSLNYIRQVIKQLRCVCACQQARLSAGVCTGQHCNRQPANKPVAAARALTHWNCEGKLEQNILDSASC